MILIWATNSLGGACDIDKYQGFLIYHVNHSDNLIDITFTYDLLLIIYLLQAVS